jgi:hypothetical protein
MRFGKEWREAECERREDKQGKRNAVKKSHRSPDVLGFFYSTYSMK